MHDRFKPTAAVSLLEDAGPVQSTLLRRALAVALGVCAYRLMVFLAQFLPLSIYILYVTRNTSSREDFLRVMYASHPPGWIVDRPREVGLVFALAAGAVCRSISRGMTTGGSIVLATCVGLSEFAWYAGDLRPLRLAFFVLSAFALTLIGSHWRTLIRRFK